MSDSAHGIAYTPSSVIASNSFITTQNLKQLQETGIAYVRLQWVDFTGVVRFRVLPIVYFLKLLESSRPGVGVPTGSFGAVYNQVADGFTSTREYILTPDLSSLRTLPFEPNTVGLMGWFQQKAPSVGLDGKTSFEVDLCPRTILDRTVKSARDLAQVEFLVGFETEFILLKHTDPAEPASHHFWSGSNALRSGSVVSQVLRDIADSLEKAGIPLTMYHAECAPGQYEVVTEPMLPLEAADALVFTRETIVNIAAKHSLRATFAPHVFSGHPGNGAHCHISIHSTTLSDKTSSTLTTQESSFLASVLDNIPSLMALTVPIPASYKRVGDNLWSGGTYVCWGTENREALIRLTNASSPSSRNFELRFLDSTCNPYLALAGIIAVGAKGIRTNAELKVKDCSGPLSAAQLSEEARQRLGITKRVSLNWSEARKNFGDDEMMKEIFGKNFVDKYLSVNKKLGELLEQDDHDEQRKLTRLINFY